jgi:N-acetylmuramic acid 6-phosphate (MurNAc-6-P) etherase
VSIDRLLGTTMHAEMSEQPASPSVHLLYEADVDFSGYVVIAVSQSGRTPEIATVLERAKASGGRRSPSRTMPAACSPTSPTPSSPSAPARSEPCGQQRR